MQLLAQGLERLLKLTYALATLKQSGRLPPTNVFKGRQGYKHDLIRLTDDLTKLVRQVPQYVDRPAVQQDLMFIEEDETLRRILSVLTSFSTWSRYYRFEEFLCPDDMKASEDPDQLWATLEMDILQRRPSWMELLRDSSKRQEVYDIIAREITTVLERFARAITRMWTFGAVHETGSAHVGVIKDFLFLRDDDLGTGLLR